MAKRVRSELEQNLRFLVSLVLGVLALQTFVVRPFYIPSESMLPRMFIGDYLFVAKWPYGYSRWSVPFGFLPVPGRLFGGTPRRGDVVVFRSPEVIERGATAPSSHDVVKRVIGLPGDTVQVRRGQLILNGVAVPKDRVGDFVLPLTPNFTNCPVGHEEMSGKQVNCRYARFRETLPGGRSYTVLDTDEFKDRDETGLYAVPPGTVFLMGDNRDNSADSRFPPGPALGSGMGYVPLDRLEGRALLTFFSTDGSSSYLKPWTWFSAARPERMGHGF